MARNYLNMNKFADLKFSILAASHEVLRKFLLRKGLLHLAIAASYGDLTHSGLNSLD